MSRLLYKFIPTVVVLAAGGYVVWPYVGSERAAAPAAQAAPAAGSELQETLLKPKLVPRTVRNPFDDPEEEAARVLQSLRESAAAAAKRLEQSIRQRVALARTQARTAQGPKAKGAAAGSGPGGATAESPLAGLELNATYTEKGKGAALINGRVVRIGETVRDLTPGEHLVLTEVGPYSVILRASDRRFEMPFSKPGAAARPGRDWRAPWPGGPPGAAGARGPPR